MADVDNESIPPKADADGDSFQDADEGIPPLSRAKNGGRRVYYQDHEPPEKFVDRTPAENNTPAYQLSPLPEESEDVTPSWLRPMSPDTAVNGVRNYFGWLSRRASTPTGAPTGDKPTSPTGSLRRGTAWELPSLLAYSIGASYNNEAEEPIAPVDRRLHSISLKDRFKLVRMKEEAGIDSLEGDEKPESEAADAERQTEDGADTTPPKDATVRRSRTSSTATLPGQPTLNVLLPPGTAAGTSAGPEADHEEPVDWDLWQEVVYDGPAAVARTSGNQLTQATMRGIPSAIRGVVWQVLAQSKNDELEVVYKDLVARGGSNRSSSNEMKPRTASHSRPRFDSVHFSRPKDSGISSSRSSIHSDIERSSDTLSHRNSGVPSSPPISQGGVSLEALASEQASAIEVESKRQAEDTAALHKLERAIKRDLGARTSFSKFLMSAGLQDGLFGICKAYALFDAEVGYAQGMNFIAMPLLFNMPEEEAFCLFVRLMNNYNLRDQFIPEMPGLHLHLYQFERLLEDLEPALYCHLHRRGVSPQLYATQWFLTLFAYRFPLQLVLRIYDLILSDGLEIAILRFAIVLMQKNAKELLDMKDMAVLTTFLKERIFDYYIDKSPSASSLLESGFFGSAGGIDREVYRADELVKDACAVSITSDLLKTYTDEWNEKCRDEKERQAADEALRAANTSLSLQVRSLRERVEKSDTEHVQLASDLVRTRVENQRLTDDNESLQGRVKELQEIVQAQPGEVEDKLRQEMDRIMQRNIEVQNENRALEDSQTEMEGELISAKLGYAEVHAELDDMRQKWSSIQQMMGGLVPPPTTTWFDYFEDSRRKSSTGMSTGMDSRRKSSTGIAVGF